MCHTIVKPNGNTEIWSSIVSHWEKAHRPSHQIVYARPVWSLCFDTWQSLITIYVCTFSIETEDRGESIDWVELFSLCVPFPLLRCPNPSEIVRLWGEISVGLVLMLGGPWRLPGLMLTSKSPTTGPGPHASAIQTPASSKGDQREASETSARDGERQKTHLNCTSEQNSDDTRQPSRWQDEQMARCCSSGSWWSVTSYLSWIAG